MRTKALTDYAEADHANNVRGVWANRVLGSESAVPPDTGGPRPLTPADDEADSDVELDEDERVEVAGIEQECAELQRA